MGIFIILTRFPTDIFPAMMSLAAIIIIADKAPLKWILYLPVTAYSQKQVGNYVGITYLL